MLARLRPASEEHDEGFTLIELLVVMIIIGILAAIAIPVFLNQRQKAVDSAMKSDLRTVANAVETYYTDAQTYLPLNADATLVTDDVSLSDGNEIAITSTTDAFCVEATRATGASSASYASWSYDSDGGGLVANGGDCAP